MPRGRLRIYLGAAPGVGKTVAMLAEGARRRERGADVVVGLVETHERPYTASAVGDLEVVPRRLVEHRGSSLTELDVPAILARRPQIVLVDELAHTNAPGSPHAKRWQDVRDLLAAGVDVISTVNIQHLESLNDVVESITGIRQRETVPDDVVREADQIELVDMSPEALRRRLAHGNVYKPEKVDAALANYFRPGNLAALRELALLWLADRVDEGLALYRADQGITGIWATRERVVVALTGGREGRAQLRRGARIASRGAGGDLHAVYVARSDGLAGASLPEVGAQRALTEELGGTFHVVSGDDVAEAILDLARGLNATQIVVGTSRRSRWQRLLAPGVGEAVVADAGDIDVLVMPHEQESGPRGRSGLFGLPGLPRSRVAWGAVLAVLGPILLTLPLRAALGPEALTLIVLLYTLLTVLVAVVGGLWPALVCAVLSSVLINWFFTPPVDTLTIAEPVNAVALLLFVGVAVTVATLVHVTARRAAQALEAESETAALAELTQSLIGSTDMLSLLLTRAAEMLRAHSAAVLWRQEEHAPWVVLESSDAPPGAARATVGPTAGTPGPPLESTPTEAARERIDDYHVFVVYAEALPSSAATLVPAFAANASAILTRRALRAQTRSADELARDNRARTALLSAVSHDLRTPLAGVKAAVSALRTPGMQLDAADQAELLASIEESADRLDDLIGNLLDMSRIEAGALTARREPLTVRHVVLGTVRLLSDPARVLTSGDADVRALGDAGLLDRVLANLAENALRHAPPDAPVRIAWAPASQAVEIHVVDTGPGVDDATKERMFLPFRRYGDTSTEGVGLGLAVARGLAEAMGGTVSARDTPGGGLTMVVRLPGVQEPEHGVPRGEHGVPDRERAGPATEGDDRAG